MLSCSHRQHIKGVEGDNANNVLHTYIGSNVLTNRLHFNMGDILTNVL